jgi:hypothetical protein
VKAIPFDEDGGSFAVRVNGEEQHGLWGVDDSFFDLGGDSILSMQVTARAGAAEVLCRPRDVFVEQTVARLAQVATVATDATGGVDEGVGPVVATPIMRWLRELGGERWSVPAAVTSPAPRSRTT